MALDGTSFVARFPEFSEVNEVSPATITAALADAAIYCDSVLWGTRYESGVMWKAAHLLALTPLGEGARLSKTSEQTTYGVVFDSMKRALPVRMLTT